MTKENKVHLEKPDQLENQVPQDHQDLVDFAEKMDPLENQENQVQSDYQVNLVHAEPKEPKEFQEMLVLLAPKDYPETRVLRVNRELKV